MYLYPVKINNTINNQLKSVMDIITTHSGIKRKDIAIILRTVSRYVKELTDQELENSKSYYVKSRYTVY